MKKKKFSHEIKPMLATLVDKPFDEEGWLYEIKWDGYRTIAYLNHGDVEMKSRNNKSFNEKFYPIYNTLKKWEINAVLDGEIIVANEKGISDFSKLQSWRSEADGALLLYVFDLLWYDGNDLTSLPLIERKEILNEIFPSLDNIRISERFNAGATEFFDEAKKLRLEGIIAKKQDSKYHPGGRSKEWLKIKTGRRQEVIIGGYTCNEGSNKSFSSLLVGVYEKGKLIYTGKIGTGFTINLQKEMMKRFIPLQISKSPFTTVPDVNKPSRFRPDLPKAIATWLKPALICEVSYTEMTSDGVMRHPSFKGMREDKNPADVVKEKENNTEKLIGGSKVADNKKKAKKANGIKTRSKKENEKLASSLLNPVENTSRKTLLNPKDKSQTRCINGHDITFNNLDKIYFPKKKVTKRDVINYYYVVAPYMLPYMKDRPQTLIRYPNGIDGKSFYQKDVTGKVPEWVKQFPFSSERGGKRNFFVCTNEASLLLIASMGGLEMHPWSSRTQMPDKPDWCIIDLDPSSKTTFEQVILTAQTIKKILDDIGVPAYCKTSGATGLHIYIPLGAKYTYEQSKELARMIAKIAHKEISSFTSIERIIKNRNNKLYIDFLQNRPHATLAAPYSLRPKPNATVSMPLHWEEVTKSLRMDHFTIFNAVERLQSMGDVFNGVLGKGINLEKTLNNMDKVYGKQQRHKSLAF
ncbi:MAG: DNA ligase D [Ginsengibacter sp.]